METSDFLKIYKELFKEKKINLKGFEREIDSENKYISDMIFDLMNNVSYGVRIYSELGKPHYAVIGRINRKQAKTDIDIKNTVETFKLQEPTPLKIVDAIAKDYNNYLKSKSFVRRMISKIIKEEINK